MTLNVRRATAADAPVLRSLRHRSLVDAPSAFGSTISRERSWGTAVYAERLDSGVGVLAYADDLPVGLGSAFHEGDWLHVVGIWVDPDFRGRGLNRLLLLEIVGGHNHVCLDVTVGNDTARRSYERFGFVATGETHPLRDGSAEVVERMVLPTRG